MTMYLCNANQGIFSPLNARSTGLQCALVLLFSLLFCNSNNGNAIVTMANTINPGISDLWSEHITTSDIDISSSNEDIIHPLSSSPKNRTAVVAGPVLAVQVEQRADYNGSFVAEGDAGDRYVYTVRISNTGDAPAYDVEMVDIIPVKFVQQYGLFIITGSNLGPYDFNGTTGRLSVIWTEISASSSVSITIRLEVKNTVRPLDTWTNTADVGYNALPDPDGSSGGAKDYTVTATSASFSVPEPQVAIQVEHPSQTPVAAYFNGAYSDSSSDPSTNTGRHTADVDAAIGETFSYIITVTFPEGTTAEFTMIDLLSPIGLSGGRQFRVVEMLSAEVIFVGANLSVGDLGAVGTSYTIYDHNGDGDGTRSDLHIGGNRNVLNTPDNVVDDNDRYIIRITARMDDEDESGADALAGLSNNDGDVTGNRLQYQWKDSDERLYTENLVADVEIVEPALSLHKAVTDTDGNGVISGDDLNNARPGDEVTFTFKLVNNGSATAYNTRLSDNLDPIFDLLAVTTTQGSDHSDLTNDQVNVSIGSLPIGGSATITARVRIRPNPTFGATYTNTASTNYQSLPASGPDIRNYVASDQANVSIIECQTTITEVTATGENCPGVGDGTITVSATSNTGNSLTYSVSGPESVTNNDGRFTNLLSGVYTVKVTDNGAATCQATQMNVSVAEGVDNTPPTALTQNINIQLDDNGAASITAGQIDNSSSDLCGIASITVSPSSFDCTHLGTNTVTLTVTDNNGNVNSATATVTVEDKVAPTATCRDVTVQLDAGGHGSTNVAAIDNGSRDACGIADRVLDKTDFTCADVKLPNTVTLTATDVNGNTASCTATVTVEDKVAPVARCRDITVKLDENGYTVINVAMINNGSNDACGIHTYALGPVEFNCSMLGPQTVTMRVTDFNRNTSSCTATVTVDDAPTAQCKDVTIQLDESNTASITTLDIDNNSFSPCGNVGLSISQTTFDCSNVGANTVTLTATNDSGDAATCTATVTVEDPFPPVIVCKDITVELPPSGEYLLYHEDVEVSSSDNCAVGGGYIYPNLMTCADAGTTVTVEVIIGDLGNTSERGVCYSRVTVVGAVVKCKDLAVNLDANGQAGITVAQINDGSYGVCAPITDLSLDINSFNCADVGSNTVTLTATDGNGKNTSCQSTVTVSDNIPPTVTCKNSTVELNASGFRGITTGDVIADYGWDDNCTLPSILLSTSGFNCSDIGSNIVTVTAFDRSGNRSSCDATVTVEEKTAPTALCKPTVTAQLDANGPAIVLAADLDDGSTDNCNGALTFSFADGTSQLALDCNSVEYQLIVTDVSGNQSTCTGSILIKDGIAPTATCKNATVELDAGGRAALDPAQINNGSSDNCGIAGLSASPVQFNCLNLGANTVTLTVSDHDGNTSTCDATVTVVDPIPPVIDACAPPLGIVPVNANCAYILPDLRPLTLFEENCSATVSQVPAPGTLLEIGAHNILMTVTDEAGNTSSCTTTVTVVDETAPTALCKPVVWANLDANGRATVLPADLDDGSTDNCGGVLAFAFANGSDQLDLDCSSLSLRRDLQLIVTDLSGNQSTCFSTIRGADNIDPIARCKDITIELDADGQANFYSRLIDDGSTDNCGIDTRLNSISKLTCTDIGSFEAAFTVEDGSGNTSSCTGLVTVVDNAPPVVVCRDLTVSLNDRGYVDVKQSDAVVSVSDNCELERNTLEFNLDCRHVGAYTGTVREYDVNGNIGTCITQITVLEVTPPEMYCRDLTVQLDANGSAVITAADIDNRSFDRCGVISSLSLDRTDFGCADLGDHIVTLTGTDSYGNASACSATVTVRDQMNPVALCQDVSVTLPVTGTVSITGADVDGGSMDNCSIAGRSVSPSTFGTADAGDQKVTLTVTDASGNTSSKPCLATVTVQKRPVAITYSGDKEVQYSDQATLQANLKDEQNNQPLSGQTLTFTIGTQSVDATTDASGVASTTLILDQGPGNYEVTVAYAGNERYGEDAISEDFLIKQENARAYYTGPSFVSTGSSRSSQATILLTATIEDIKDLFRGDIRNATVYFVDRFGGRINPTPLSVSPISQTVGTVAYEWTVDIGREDAEQYTIGIQVGNYYFFDNKAEEDVIINVAKALNEEFVTGGGYLNLCCSKGAYAGDPGTKNNFGFNIKYNKKGTNLIGKIRTLFRRYESDGILHTYQIKGNQMESLSVQGGYAEFTGKANVQDVTDPSNPISVEGNGSFIVKMNDNGESGGEDNISFALYDRNGALLFASNFSGNLPTLQNLGGGNLQVHSGRGGRAMIAGPGSTGSPLFTAPQLPAERFTMEAFPNPFQSELKIQFNIPEAGRTSLYIFNLQGQMLRRLQDDFLEAGEHQIQWNGESENGQALPSGIYLVQLRMGTEVINKRVVLQRF